MPPAKKRTLQLRQHLEEGRRAFKKQQSEDTLCVVIAALGVPAEGDSEFKERVYKGHRQVIDKSKW